MQTIARLIKKISSLCHKSQNISISQDLKFCRSLKFASNVAKVADFHKRNRCVAQVLNLHTSSVEDQEFFLSDLDQDDGWLNLDPDSDDGDYKVDPDPDPDQDFQGFKT
jgi:hypothetical protein